MKIYDIIFLDRDGTLNPDPGYIANIKQFSFYPYTIKALVKLSDICNGFCIVTNQSGIGRGIIQPDKLDEIHQFIKKEFKDNHLHLLDIYVCPDHPDVATHNRKPMTGMFEKAAKDFKINIHECLMIGDTGSDIEAGAKLGIETMLVLTGKGSETLENIKNLNPTHIVNDLLAGAELLGS